MPYKRLVNVPLGGGFDEDISNDSPIFTSSFATISRLSAAICNSFSLFFAAFETPRRVLGGGTGGVLFSSFSVPSALSCARPILICWVVSDLEDKLNDVDFKLGDSGGVLKSSKPDVLDLIVSDFCFRFCCIAAQSIGGTRGGVFFLTEKKESFLFKYIKVFHSILRQGIYFPIFYRAKKTPRKSCYNAN